MSNNVRDRFSGEIKETNLPAYELWKIYFFLMFCIRVNKAKMYLLNMMTATAKHNKDNG